MTQEDQAFYEAWTELLSWMRDFAAAHEGVRFEKQADFPNYIYRMERPYDLPTTIMSASLSLPNGSPVLMVNASPRHTVFKEVVLHAIDGHTYRTLKLAGDGTSLAEGKRIFSRSRLEHWAEELFSLPRLAGSTR